MKSISIIVIITALLSIFGTSYSAGGKYGAVDVVYVVDIGDMYRNQINQWLNNAIPRLEQQLTAYGFGDETQIKNNYGLVVFGGRGYTKPVAVQIDGKSLVDSQSFANRAIQSIPQPTGDTTTERSDGYEAIDLALNYPFRQNTKKLFIFISPRHRQIINTALDRNTLLQKMKQKNVVMNIIVDASFTLESPSSANVLANRQMMKKVMGIIFENSERISFYYNTSGAQAQSNWNYQFGGHILGENSHFTTVDDYVSLVEQHSREDCLNKLRVGGSAWDIKLLLPNDRITQLFNDAFFYSKAFELTLASVLPIIPIMPTFPNQSFPDIILPNVTLPKPIIFPNITSRCPYPNVKVIVGDKLYFLPDGLFNFEQGRAACSNLGGQIVTITSIQELLMLRSVLTQTVWINLANNVNQSLVLFLGHAFTIVAQSQSFLTLCEVNHAPGNCMA